MELLYILYKGVDRKLIYPLGDRNGKLCCLITASIPKNEIEAIRSHLNNLPSISLEGKLRWLKTHCPVAYKNSYREINNTNYTVVSRHKMY
jgi:hypothetical protein